MIFPEKRVPLFGTMPQRGKRRPKLLAGSFQYLLGRVGVGGAGGEQNGSFDDATAFLEQAGGIVAALAADGGDHAHGAVAELDVVGGEIDHVAVMDMAEMGGGER